jgi:hypothetical protein
VPERTEILKYYFFHSSKQKALNPMHCSTHTNTRFYADAEKARVNNIYIF